MVLLTLDASSSTASVCVTRDDALLYESYLHNVCKLILFHILFFFYFKHKPQKTRQKLRTFYNNNFHITNLR